jgi:hypothetical protein
VTKTLRPEKVISDHCFFLAVAAPTAYSRHQSKSRSEGRRGESTAKGGPPRQLASLLVLSGLMVVALAPPPVYAQAVGSIIGSVGDSAGAIIPGAKVTATDKATGFTRATTTASDGVYSLPRLPVGTYAITASSSGFEQSSLEVRLDVEQRQEVNFTLSVQGIATKLEVTAVAPTINTTTGTIGGLVEGRQVANLPLNGRDITNLILMQPGQVPENNEGGTAGNGNRGTTNSSYLDGMDSSDNELGGFQISNFNLDAISEFKILQNNYSAEYGRGSGTIVSTVSKTGTNDFHGSAFEFVRNDALDARNFFAPSVAPFRRNEFGVTFGGPILIPKVYNGKNKTFFFFDWASYRQRLAVPVVIPVPTAAERQGQVTITPASGAPYVLQVPVTSAASTILNAYPLPTNPNGVYGPRTFQGAFSQPTNRDQYSGRLDQRFSDKDSFFFRYTVSNILTPDSDANEAVINPTYSVRGVSNSVNSGLSETHLFSPNLMNEVRISGMQSVEQDISAVEGVTQVGFADGALQSYGPDDGGGGFSLEPFTMNYRDSVTWVKGRHTMNIGGEYRTVHSSYFGTSVGGPNGDYVFAAGSALPEAIQSTNGQVSLAAGSPSPSSIVSFMEGISQYYARAVAYPGFGPPGGGFAPFSMRRYVWSGWFQDDFKVTKNLTLNLGLRYEYNSVPTETGDRLAGIINEPNFINPSLYLRMVLNPQPIYRQDYKGYAPRLGFAWQVHPKTVIRGGFAIFTNLPLSQTADQQGFNFPFAGYSTPTNLMFTLTPRAVSLPPIRDLSGNIVPSNGNSKTVPPNDPINLTPYGPGLETNLTSDDNHNGYTISGNLTVERELPFNTVLSAGYVFNNAIGLYASQYPNGFTDAPAKVAIYTDANPGLGEFQLTDNHAHSTYNSLQVALRKNMPTAGVTFQLSYTYSKAIDNATTVYNGDSANSAFVQENPFCWSCEKARASFDVPQRVVVNFAYQLPFDKAAASLPKRLTQGWTLWGIATASSGFPFTVVTPFGSSEYGIDTYGGGTVRPNLVSTPTLKPSGQGPEEQFFSNAVLQDSANFGAAVANNQSFAGQFFAVPLASLNGNTVAAEPGNLGRNTFRGASWSDFDLSLAKDSRLFEHASLQFRAEFFNILNQHAFSIPSGASRTLGSPGFGIATSTIFDPREIQLGLRLIF